MRVSPDLFAARERQSGSAHAVTLSDLTEVAAVTALRDEWRELVAVAAPASPFMTWEWLECWYRVYADCGEIHCLVARDGGGALMGLAPLFLSQQADDKLRPGELGFASTHGHSWGFGLEVLTAPGAETAVGTALADYLVQTRRQWRALKLLRMSASSRSLSALVSAAARQDLPVVVRQGLTSFVQPLPARVDSFGDWLPSANRRKQTRRLWRRLQNDHAPRFHQSADPDEFERCLQALVELNLAQRTMSGTPSSFARPEFTECFLETTRRLRERGWLRLSALETTGEVLALSTDVLFGDCLYLLQPAYNAQYAAYAPGHILTALVAEQAIAAGAREMDLLPGGDYKAHYARERRPLLDVTILNYSLPGSWQVASSLMAKALGRTVRARLRRHR